MSQAGFPRIVQNTLDVATPFTLLPSRLVTFGLFADRLADGDKVVVMIVHPGKDEWQECLCTFTRGAPDTLTVLHVFASSNADAAVAFTAGTKNVMVCEPSYSLRAAERLRFAVDCASTVDVTLATVTAGATLQGLTLVAGQRVALLNQTTSTEIGIYAVTAGDPVRVNDFSTGDTVSGAIVPILGGTYAGNVAVCTAAAGADVVGTHALTWSINGGGNVKTTLPTTADCVASWNDTAGTLRPSSGVKVHQANSDKLEYVSRFGAILTRTTASAGVVSLDLDTANDWQIVMGGNWSLAYTHVSLDQLVTLLITQDATGGWSPSWWANIIWADGVAPVIDMTASTGWNLVRLICIGTDGYGVPIWYEVSRRSSSLAGSVFHLNGNNELLQLDGSAHVPTANLPTSVTLQGNTFNGADELLQLDGGAHVPTANLPASVTVQGNTFNGASELVQLDAGGKLPAVDGSQLTNIPGVGLHTTASLTFGSVGPAGTVTVTATLTGALTTDSVWCAPRGNLVGPFNWYAWVSSANTITVQITNAGTIAATPSVLTWDFRIWR